MEEFENRIREIVASSGAHRFAMSLERFDRPLEFDLDGDAVFHAASTMKVPVMAEAFRWVGDGRLLLDEEMPVENRFSSALDGSFFSTCREDDSDPALYDWVGRRLPVVELIERMITRSSNLATNLLVQRMGAESVQELLGKLGCGAFRVVRGVEDQKAFRAGLVNQTTASSYRRLLSLISVGAKNPNASSLASCDQMLSVLKRQRQRRGIPSGASEAMWVANKPGDLETLFHDGAIVQGSGDLSFALVVCTEGIPWEEGAEVASEVARSVWNFFSHLH